MALMELITVYIVFPIFSAFVIILALVAKNTFLILFGAVYMLFFVWVAIRKVRYDSNFLTTIDIKEAPPYVTQLLSETTSRGVLINQLIIETLNENPQISQTELYKRLPIQPAIRPTKERVRQFALKLQKSSIIRDIAPNVSEGRNCVYVLTERGKWCVSAINQYYPRYYVSFLVRVILKTHFRKELPSFESLKND